MEVTVFWLYGHERMRKIVKVKKCKYAEYTFKKKHKTRILKRNNEENVGNN